MNSFKSMLVTGFLFGTTIIYGQGLKPHAKSSRNGCIATRFSLSEFRPSHGSPNAKGKGKFPANAVCNIPCCDQQFLYEFCNPTDGSIFVACSANPNNDSSNGLPAKAFIPSCIQVDNMPDNAIWQPTGPPAQPGALLGNDGLNDNPNEESGAATQQTNDQQLFIGGSPPVDPSFEPSFFPITSDPGPEPSCGDSAPYPNPEYPDLQSIWDRYVQSGFTQGGGNYVVPPYKHPYDYQWKNYWDDDESEYEAAMAQWSLDSSDFLSGFDQEKTDESGMDGNAQDAVTWYYNTDDGWLWEEYNNELATYDTEMEADSSYNACITNLPDEVSQWEQDTANYSKYLGAEQQYRVDLAAWNNNVNSYVQVFNQSTAQSEASDALHQWLGNVCSPSIQPCEANPQCCIHVVMDDDEHDFGDPTILAKTTGSGPTTFLTCQPSGCSSSVIEVDISDLCLSYQRQADATPADPNNYTLHTVNYTELYTGTTPPATQPGYDCYSFYELMLHEIGHYLGLHHPDQMINGHQCLNCYTANPFWTPTGGPDGTFNTSGFRTVMALNNIVPNQVSLENPNFPPQTTLGSEDECQFQKLYCNTCGGGSGTPPCAYDAGVAAREQDDFDASIHPNPTTGASELDYTVPARSFVQIAIYDELGKQLRLVSADYEGAGTRTISLGTESLPSGHYVCRVRVGEEVMYINIVVKR